MVLEVNRVFTGPSKPRTHYFSLPESVAPSVVPFPIDHQNFDHGSLEQIIALEQDPSLTVCDILPIAAADRMVFAENPKHLLIWKGKNNQAIFHKIDNIGQVKPLDKLAIDWQPQAGFLQATDVINDRETAQLIHIGPPFETNNGYDQLLFPFLADVENYLNIEVGTLADSRYTHWHAAYDNETGLLSIFSTETGAYMTANLSRESRKNEKPFYLKYLNYLQLGGCISLEFMRDATNLSLEEMQNKYKTAKNLPNETPPTKLAEYAADVTGLKLNQEQLNLLANLTAVPSNFRYSVYMDGLVTSNTNQEEREISFIHPADLLSIGRLGEVLKYTGDTENRNALDAYLMENSIYGSGEIDPNELTRNISDPRTIPDIDAEDIQRGIPFIDSRIARLLKNKSILFRDKYTFVDQTTNRIKKVDIQKK